MKTNISVIRIRAASKLIAEIKHGGYVDKDCCAAVFCTDWPLESVEIESLRHICAHFLDTENPYRPHAFSRQQALMISGFLTALPEHITTLYCCCDWGQSRSAGLAAACMTAIGQDYESVFHSRSYTPNMLVYTLMCEALGCLPSADRLSYRLPEDTKDELLVRGLNAYAPVLKDKMNEELQKDRWGRCFTIGAIFVEKQGGIILDIGQIAVDYQGLLNNERVSGAIKNRLGKWAPLANVAKTAVGVATVFAGDSIERRGLDLLQQDGNRERVLELLKSILVKYGIKIDVDNIQIVQVPKVTEDVIELTEPFTLSEKMEEDIISALAGYLRDNVADELTII